MSDTGNQYTAEQIVKMLSGAEVELSKGQTITEVAKRLGITEQTYSRWRHKYGGLRAEQVQRLTKLEQQVPLTTKRDEPAITNSRPIPTTSWQVVAAKPLLVGVFFVAIGIVLVLVLIPVSMNGSEYDQWLDANFPQFDSGIRGIAGNVIDAYGNLRVLRSADAAYGEWQQRQWLLRGVGGVAVLIAVICGGASVTK